MINLILVTLSENDKRIIFALLIGIILIIALVGYLSYLLVRLVKWQGRKIETLTADAVNTKVIIDPKHLRRYGTKKNWAMYFKQAIPPLIIAAVGVIVLIIRNSIYNDFSYNPFSIENGFGTLIFTFKFSGELTGNEYDLIRFSKIVVDNYPHFIPEAWGGYVVAPCFMVSGVWYFLVASSLLGRTIHLEILCRNKFEKEMINPNSPQSQNPNPNNQNPNNL